MDFNCEGLSSNGFVLDNPMKRITTLSLPFLLVLGCVAPPKNYQRKTSKNIDMYYTIKPTKPYTEIQRISVDFREFGYFTGTATDEILIKMLKDKAALVGGDAILNVQIDSQPAGGGSINLIWHASGIAIKYRTQTSQDN